MKTNEKRSKYPVVNKVLNLLVKNLSAKELDEFAELVDGGYDFEDDVSKLNFEVNPESYK